MLIGVDFVVDGSEGIDNGVDFVASVRTERSGVEINEPFGAEESMGFTSDMMDLDGSESSKILPAEET